MLMTGQAVIGRKETPLFLFSVVMASGCGWRVQGQRGAPRLTSDHENLWFGSMMGGGVRKWGAGHEWLVEESSWPCQGLLAHPRAQMSYWSCGSSRAGDPHLSLLSPVSPPIGWMCPSYPNSADTWGQMKMLQTDFFCCCCYLCFVL